MSFIKEARLQGLGAFCSRTKIPFKRLALLIGANGSGKSTVLRSITAFSEVMRNHNYIPGWHKTTPTDDPSLTFDWLVSSNTKSLQPAMGITIGAPGHPWGVTADIHIDGRVNAFGITNVFTFSRKGFLAHKDLTSFMVNLAMKSLDEWGGYQCVAKGTFQQTHRWGRQGCHRKGSLDWLLADDNATTPKTTALPCQIIEGEILINTEDAKLPAGTHDHHDLNDPKDRLELIIGLLNCYIKKIQDNHDDTPTSLVIKRQRSVRVWKHGFSQSLIDLFSQFPKQQYSSILSYSMPDLALHPVVYDILDRVGGCLLRGSWGVEILPATRPQLPLILEHPDLQYYSDILNTGRVSELLAMLDDRHSWKTDLRPLIPRGMSGDDIKGEPFGATLFVEHDGRSVPISSIGDGYRQVIPILAALADRDLDLIMIQQPELHLHPQLQYKLGQLLAQDHVDWPDRQLIVETHSEHMLSGIRDAVRTGSVDPSEIGIIGLEKRGANKSPMVSQLSLLSDGRLSQPLPEDFFPSTLEFL